MPVVRIHRYSVDPADLGDLLDRRIRLIDAIRMAHPGLAATRLTRLPDGTFDDTWYWETAEDMEVALAAIGSFPEARAAMSLTKGNVVQNGVVVSER